MNLNRTKLVALTAAIVLLTTSACSSPNPDGNSGSATGNPAVKQTLSAIMKAGVLKVAGPATNPPYLFKDENDKVVGIEADMVETMAKHMGLKVEWTNTEFAGMITALQAGRVDIAMSNFSDTADRQKQVDFVDYARGATGMLVPAGNPGNVSGIDSFCGLTAAVSQGTLAEKVVTKQAEVCKSSGKKELTMLVLPSNSAAQLQVENKRADVMLIDTVFAKYQATKSDGKLELVSTASICPNLHGGALLKEGNDDLKDAMVKALTAMMKDGSYAEVLKTWDKYDASTLAIDKIVINGATTDPGLALQGEQQLPVCP